MCWRLATPDFGRDTRSSDSLRRCRNFVFWSGKQRTISPISRRTIFTNFAHNNVDRCRDVNFQNRILKILSQGVVFPKTQKFLENFQFLATSGRQNSRNDNRSPETHGQNNSLRDVYFPFSLLESIQSHFPGLYTLYRGTYVPHAPTVSLLMIGCRLRTMQYMCNHQVAPQLYTYSKWELLCLFRLQLKTVTVQKITLITGNL